MCISNPLVSSDGGRSLTKVSPINQSALVKKKKKAALLFHMKTLISSAGESYLLLSLLTMIWIHSLFWKVFSIHARWVYGEISN